MMHWLTLVIGLGILFALPIRWSRKRTGEG